MEDNYYSRIFMGNYFAYSDNQSPGVITNELLMSRFDY